VVLTDQAAKDLPTLDPGRDVDGASGLPRRFLLQALMRPVTVIVAGELGQHSRRCPSPRISTWSRHPRRSVPTNRSANELPLIVNYTRSA
jgi:hypothetical protein